MAKIIAVNAIRGRINNKLKQRMIFGGILHWMRTSKEIETVITSLQSRTQNIVSLIANYRDESR